MDRLEAMSILLTVVETGSLSAAGRRAQCSAGDGQPQGFGAGGASGDAAVQPLQPPVHAHRRRPRLYRVLPPHSRRCRGGGTRRLGRIPHAQGRPDHHARRLCSGACICCRWRSIFCAIYPEIDIKVVFGDKMVDLLEDHVDLALAHRRAARQRALRHPSRDDPPRCLRQSGLSRRTWRSARPRRTRNSRLRRLPDLERRGPMEVQDGDDHAARPAGRQYGGSRNRRRHRRCRRHPGAELSGGRRHSIRRARASCSRHFEPPPLPVSLVHSGERLLPLKLRAFLDFATPRLKARVSRAALHPASDESAKAP